MELGGNRHADKKRLMSCPVLAKEKATKEKASVKLGVKLRLKMGVFLQIHLSALKDAIISSCMKHKIELLLLHEILLSPYATYNVLI